MSTLESTQPNYAGSFIPVARWVLILTIGIASTFAALSYYQMQRNDTETGRMRMDKNSGRNEPHANQKARDKAQQEYEKIREEFQNWNRKPNKTPDDKKFIEKLRKQLERFRKKKDFGGENHSQKHKGN